MSTKRNIIFDKKRFDITKKWCLKNGIVPQIGKLKITRPIMDGVGLIDFDLKSRQLICPGDVSLFDNDVFVPMGMGIFLSIDDKEKPTGKAPLYSYAPKAGAQNAYGFTTSDIEGIYNGVLKQTVDQTAVMQAFPCEVFKHIGSSEPASVLNSENKAESIGIQGEYDIEDMMHPLTPNIVYQGLMDIRTSLEFNATGSDFSVAAAATPTTADETKQAYVTLFMIGVLVKNGAQSGVIDQLTNALSENN